MTWDGTINLGTVLAALGVIFAIVGFGHRVLGMIGQAKEDVSDLKKDVADMKPKVDMILVMQQAVHDANQRMDRMEDRLLHVERVQK